MTMARKIYPYSLQSKDAKIAGVCSTLGARMGVDPTFIRIAWIAVPLLTHIPLSVALVAYAIMGVILAVQKKRTMTGNRRMSDFDRMDMTSTRKPTVHSMRTDHHINSQNEELAREIEALRQEEK
jgi:phage shock protein PspC (stress-responsive transcriptional regulator)